MGEKKPRAELTYCGHATFVVRAPGGSNVLIDPWLGGNPACPPELRDPGKVDVMLVTHAHFDHIGDAVAVAKAKGPTVVGIYETICWLQSQGVENTLGMNKGGTVSVGGVRVTMVHADHSCGIATPEGQIIYAGEAVGYVVELESGLRLYHAGDTAVFGDMKVIGELYRPEVALLPIGDLYTMGPQEAALAIRLLGVRRVVPMHYGTFPPLTGTPQALRELTGEIAGLEIIEMRPGERRTLE